MSSRKPADALSDEDLIALLEEQMKTFSTEFVRLHDKKLAAIKRCADVISVPRSSIVKHSRKVRIHSILTDLWETSTEFFVLAALAATPSRLGSLKSIDYLPKLVQWRKRITFPKGLVEASKHTQVLAVLPLYKAGCPRPNDDSGKSTMQPGPQLSSLLPTASEPLGDHVASEGRKDFTTSNANLVEVSTPRNSLDIQARQQLAETGDISEQPWEDAGPVPKRRRTATSIVAADFNEHIGLRDSPQGSFWGGGLDQELQCQRSVQEVPPIANVRTGTLCAFLVDRCKASELLPVLSSLEDWPVIFLKLPGIGVANISFDWDVCMDLVKYQEENGE